MSVDIPIEVPILPCPWCGKTDKLVEHKADYDDYAYYAYYVECEDCRCHGPYYTKNETAIELWNKRVYRL